MGKKKMMMSSFGYKRPTKLSYGFYKLQNKAEFPIQAFIVTPEVDTQDIGWNGDVADLSQITAFGNGNQVYDNIIYEQGGSGYDLISASRPHISASDGTAQDYFNNYALSIGRYRKDVALDFDMSGDYIVHYCWKNERQVNSDRSNLVIRSFTEETQGNFVLTIRTSGGNWLVNCKTIYSECGKSSDHTWIVNKGSSVTEFVLWSFAYIGGVLRFYFNNVEVTNTTTTGEGVGGGNLGGIYMGIGYSVSGCGFPGGGYNDVGKITDVRGFEIQSSPDFSSLDVHANIAEKMAIFNIT